MVNKYFPKNITLNEALDMQEELAEQLELVDDIPVGIDKIGGAAMYCRGNSVTVSVAVLSFPSLNVKEKEVITEEMKFPAIHTCEGFREGKVLVDAIKGLDVPPLYMIDGHGINHPRRLGLASHVGLAMDMSTIGITRGLICGKVERMGEKEVVVENDEVYAEVVKQKPGAVPFYVSPGNKITLDTAVDITRKTFVGPVPEPLKVAHEELQEKLLKGVQI